MTGGCNYTMDVKKMSIFKLGWPIFIQSLLALCLGYADTLMITHYSETALGGVGNANQILGFLTLAFTIISSATGVIVAQYLGAKLKDKLSEIYSLSVFFNLALSLVVSAIVFIGCDLILVLMKVPDGMVEDARNYIQIVGGFMFLQALIDIFSQIFRNNGKTKIGMIISFGMNVVNITGNYIFLYGPLKHLDLGVRGVALSTTISRSVAVVVAIIYFKYKIDGHISIKYLKPFPMDTLKKLLKLGLPTAGENISYNVAQILILAFVNSFNSTVFTNTKYACAILSNFAFLYSVAAASATAIIIGHAVGANEYDYAYKKVLKTLKSGMIISVSIAIFNYIISPVTLDLFKLDSASLELGRQIMFICIFLEIGRTINLIVIYSMRAAGDVKFPTYLGMASMWGISVLVGYILAITFDMGLIGIWIAMAADEIVRGIVVFIRWHKGNWRNKSVVAKV